MHVKAQVLELEQLLGRIGTIVEKVGDSGELSITAMGALADVRESALVAGEKVQLCADLVARQSDRSGVFQHYHDQDEILEAIGKAKHTYFFAASKYFRVYKSSAIRVISSLLDSETVIATMTERDGELVLTVHL